MVSGLARLAGIGVVALAALSGVPALGAGLVDEIRVGALRHDAGVFGSHKEDGADINAELRFASPGFLRFLGAPRPDLGVSVNTDGNTSQIYGGLVWTVFPFSNWAQSGAGLFVEGGLGFAVHDGKLDTQRLDRKALGERALFHLSAEVGWSFDGVNSLSVLLDHMSNANLGPRNEGLDTLGLRFGHKF